MNLRQKNVKMWLAHIEAMQAARKKNLSPKLKKLYAVYKIERQPFFK